MNRVLLVSAVALLLLACVNAYTLADYPYFFIEEDRFKAIYVIGEEAPALDVISATVLSTALAKYPNVTTEIGTSRIDTEVPDVTTKNAIVIGSPCENRAAAQLEGDPSPCNKNLGGSAGYIKLFEHNGKVQLLITGITAEDRNQAAKFLAERSLSQLNGTTYVIPTTTNSVPQAFVQKKTNKSNQIRANNQVQNNTVTQASQSPANSPAVVVVSQEPPKPVQIGKYEPLSELPPRKGFFERMWGWLKNLF